jgi:heptosyltransferase-2/heptosyltransferase-3
VFTGGAAEQPLVAAIREQMHTPALTLAGATSIGQLAALFGCAALVLGVDSGPLHLAVSQGSPTVHLYGASDAARFGPWGNPERHQVLRSGLWCSPCGVFAQCPRGTNPPECMEHISVAQVVSACRRALQAGRGAMESGC